MKQNDFLTELEKDKLKLVASDEVMLEALKKVLLASVYFDGTIKKGIKTVPLKNFCLAIASEQGIKDEELGSKIRASLAGVQLLETGFRDLEKYKVVETTLKEVLNQAR